MRKLVLPHLVLCLFIASPKIGYASAGFAAAGYSGGCPYLASLAAKKKPELAAVMPAQNLDEPGNVKPELLDSFLSTNVRYPQANEAFSVALLRKAIASGLSPSQLLDSKISGAQRQTLGDKLNKAHAAFGIPLKVEGSALATEKDERTLSREELGKLWPKATSRAVEKIVDLLRAIRSTPFENVKTLKEQAAVADRLMDPETGDAWVRDRGLLYLRLMDESMHDARIQDELTKYREVFKLHLARKGDRSLERAALASVRQRVREVFGERARKENDPRIHLDRLDDIFRAFVPDYVKPMVRNAL